MTMRASDFEKALRVIMSTIRVELRDEFDRNFERQAFFNEKWQRRRSPGREGGALLIQTGRLRKSIKAEIRGSSVIFTSDHPAAAVHNDGAEIVVTAKMKRYFWFRYKEAVGGFGYRKDGSLRRTKKNAQLSTMAEFYKAMALKKVGSTIKIPRRRFIGEAPEVAKAVEEIITTELTKYFDNFDIV